MAVSLIKALSEHPELGLNYENLGKSGFYLAYNSQNGWKVEVLNLFLRIIRYLLNCFFQETHFINVLHSLSLESNLPCELRIRMQEIWRANYPAVALPHFLETPSFEETQNVVSQEFTLNMKIEKPFTFDTLSANLQDPEVGTSSKKNVELPLKVQSMMEKITSDPFSASRHINLLDRDLMSSLWDLLRAYETLFSHEENQYSVELLSNLYGHQTQQRYGNLMKSAIEFTKEVARKYHWNSYQKLAFLAVCRRLIEGVLRPEKQFAYGVIREKEYKWVEAWTSLATDYRCLANFYRSHFPEKMFHQCEATDFLGNPVKLSLVLFGEGEQVALYGRLYHSTGSSIEQALAHVHHLYQQAIEANGEEHVINVCGQMFWWLCHAKPWCAGDPSIAEMFFRLLLSEKEIDSSPWLENVIPWVEAMKPCTPEEFGLRFSSLFK